MTDEELRATIRRAFGDSHLPSSFLLEPVGDVACDEDKDNCIRNDGDWELDIYVQSYVSSCLTSLRADIVWMSGNHVAVRNNVIEVPYASKQLSWDLHKCISVEYEARLFAIFTETVQERVSLWSHTYYPQCITFLKQMIRLTCLRRRVVGKHERLMYDPVKLPDIKYRIIDLHLTNLNETHLHRCQLRERETNRIFFDHELPEWMFSVSIASRADIEYFCKMSWHGICSGSDIPHWALHDDGEHSIDSGPNDDII